MRTRAPQPTRCCRTKQLGLERALECLQCSPDHPEADFVQLTLLGEVLDLLVEVLELLLGLLLVVSGELPGEVVEPLAEVVDSLVLETPDIDSIPYRMISSRVRPRILLGGTFAASSSNVA